MCSGKEGLPWGYLPVIQSDKLLSKREVSTKVGSGDLQHIEVCGVLSAL